MCAIVDENVVGIVFGSGQGRPEAATKFFDRIDSGKLKLVVGGRLTQQLCTHTNFKEWLDEAVQSGTARTVSSREVHEEEALLTGSGGCRTNDEHVLALARVGGARLLNTNDLVLMNDFKNQQLVPRPRGKIHSSRTGGFTNRF